MGAAIAALVSLSSCGQPNDYVAPPPPSVDVANPVQQDVTQYLDLTGTTSSVRTVEIRARVAGFLETIEFNEGDYVEEGDLLYTIDPSEYEARVRRATGAREVARATLELREATLRRLEEARKSRAVSEIDVIEAKAQREVAAAELDSAEATLRDAELNLSYTQIHAPSAGRVGRTLVDPGNLVGAAEKTLLTRLVQYNPIYAYFDMNERQVLTMLDATDNDRNHDAESMDALRKITVEIGRSNDEGYPISGNLDYVDLDVDASTGTYLLRAVFDNPAPFALLPGLFVRARIAGETQPDALLVPDRALGSDQSGKYLLVVDENDVAQYKQVRIGELVGPFRVIDSGLDENDRVIVNGLLQTRPGARVVPNLVSLDAN
jgi:RND family efflux transporter MFP subunit